MPKRERVNYDSGKDKVKRVEIQTVQAKINALLSAFYSRLQAANFRGI
jgi:hypothetical protein